MSLRHSLDCTASLSGSALLEICINNYYWRVGVSLIAEIGLRPLCLFIRVHQSFRRTLHKFAITAKSTFIHPETFIMFLFIWIQKLPYRRIECFCYSHVPIPFLHCPSQNCIRWTFANRGHPGRSHFPIIGAICLKSPPPPLSMYRSVAAKVSHSPLSTFRCN